MSDKESEAMTMTVQSDAEFSALHNTAYQLAAADRKGLFPRALQEAAERYLLDVLRRATRGPVQ